MRAFYFLTQPFLFNCSDEIFKFYVFLLWFAFSTVHNMIIFFHISFSAVGAWIFILAPFCNALYMIDVIARCFKACFFFKANAADLFFWNRIDRFPPDSDRHIFSRLTNFFGVHILYWISSIALWVCHNLRILGTWSFAFLVHTQNYYQQYEKS